MEISYRHTRSLLEVRVCTVGQNKIDPKKHTFICLFVVVNGAFSYILTGQCRPDSEFDMIPGTNAIAK